MYVKTLAADSDGLETAGFFYGRSRVCVCVFLNIYIYTCESDDVLGPIDHLRMRTSKHGHVFGSRPQDRGRQDAPGKGCALGGWWTTVDLGLVVGPLGWFVVGARRLPLWVEGFHPHW